MNGELRPNHLPFSLSLVLAPSDKHDEEKERKNRVKHNIHTRVFLRFTDNDD